MWLFSCNCNSNQYINSLFGISFLIVLILISFNLFKHNFFFFDCLSLKNSYNSDKIGSAKLLPDGSLEYSFIIISDLDYNNKVPNKKNIWQSFLRHGKIIIDANRLNAYVEWDQNIQTLYSQISAGGRAMELSDLVYYNGKILSIDDRTGIIYEIVDFKHIIPWVKFYYIL